MALTRAQLLMGNDQQGSVLPGEVQAVKQGAGILIATDGTISVDATSVVGLVKLNNASAFNGYVWPNTKGAQGQVLTLGTGNNLTWSNGGAYVGSTPPPNPEIGDLWFDCTVGQLLTYESCTSGAPRWTSGAEGLPVLPGNTAASPAFASGSGTLLSPYVCSATTASSGSAVTVLNVVTVTGLAPFQFVNIVDLNAYVNGGRFSFTNNVADGSGILTFEIVFTDSPTSPNATTYTANIKVGNNSIYINAGVSIVDSFFIVSPGTITGSPLIGSTLTYTTGTYNGGAPPVTTSWKWYENTTGTLLQTGGATYLTTSNEFGDTVFVVFTATDVNGTVTSAPTAQFGPIDRPPFPNPTQPTIPTTTNGQSCFTWDGAGTTLRSDNCLQFKVGTGTFGQGPTAVTNGQTVCTRWNPSSSCATAADGTFIDGCLFDANYSVCSSLTIDRIPTAVTFTPATNIIPGAVATSNTVTPTGFNTPCYISYNASSTGSNWKASVNGAPFVAVPLPGVDTVSMNPGDTLAVQFTTGSTTTTTYNFVVDLGAASSGISNTFAATTGVAGFPNLAPSLVAGPSTIPGTASGLWADNTVNLTSTGCLLISTDNSTFTNSLSINNGQTLYQTWDTSSPCGGAANGTQISGTMTNGVYTNSYNFTIDKFPAGFTFTPTTNVNVNSVSTSETITLSQLNTAAYVTYGASSTGSSIEGSRDNGLTWAPIPATGGTSFVINTNQTLTVRLTVGPSVSTAYTAVLTIGNPSSGTTGTFSATTAATAGFPNLPSNLQAGPTTIPGTVAGTWADGNTTLTSTSCLEFKVGAGTFGQGPTAVTGGDTVTLQWIVSPTCGGAANGTVLSGNLTNGVNTNGYTFTIDTVPSAYSFANQTGQTTSTLVNSDIITPTGFNTTTLLTTTGGTLTAIKVSVGGGAFTTIPGGGLSVNPGQSIQIQGTTGASFTTAYTALISLGGVASTWTLTTGVATPAVATPSIVTPASDATGVGTSSGLTITSSAYSASGGAGTHLNSSWEVYAAAGLVPTTSAITAVTTTPVYTSQIPRSVRFNAPQSNYLSRSVGSNGNRRTWTFSCWVKKGAGGAQGLFVGGSTAQDQINFTFDNGSNKIAFTDIVSNVTTANLVTSDSYTNNTEWMHIVLAVNTTAGVGVGRIKLYINGVQVTGFSTAVYYPPTADTSLNSTTPFNIGVNGISLNSYLSSYLAGVHFVDGQALAPTSFGQFSGTTWIPVTYAGTYGTNGFQLLFNTNTTQITSSGSIGKDTSGNNNDFTPYGIYGVSPTSIAWYGSSAPLSSIDYVVVGQGGGGGSDSGDGPAERSGNGGQGGGGGFVSGTIAPPTAGVAYTISAINTAPTGSGSSASFTSFVAGGGGRGGDASAGGDGGGGSSGSPQNNGGSGGLANCNAGGGGAGGAASGCSSGPGATSSIRGTSESYGSGGGGGLPGTSLGGVVISYPSVYADPAIGGGLSYVKTVPSNKVFTFNRSIDIATNNPSLSLDWLVDSPTRGTQSDTGAGGEVVGNYSVLNPAAKSGPSLSNGNLDFSSSSGMVLGSVPMLNGKYYWEVQANTNLAIAGLFGVALGTTTLSNNPGGNISSWAFNAANGQVVTNSNSSAYGNTMTTNQVLGIAFDADLGKLYFAINNTWQNGGNPVSQLNPAFSNLTSGPYYATFGGSTSSRTLSVNFGVRPYVYTAPTGFKAVIANPLNDTLTFTNSTFLSSFVSGDLVSEVSGDASGVVNAINTGTNQMTVLYSNGTWTVGSQVQDDSRTVPAPAPTTEPPDSNIYTNIVDLQNSTSALTSLLVAKPPLDPFLQYFARVRYTSTAITTTSSYSPWSGFTTGAL